MNKNKECLEKVSKLIKEFLLKNGGLSNGYDTYIEGNTRYPSFTWNTPSSNKLTGIEKDKLSNNLLEKIRKVIEEYNVEEIRIKVNYRGDGCCETILEIPITKKVDLYQDLHKIGVCSTCGIVYRRL